MRDVQFSPGPWTLVEDFGGGMGDELFGLEVRAHSGDEILYFDADDKPETEANARLIAAAPDLYEALIQAKRELWLVARNSWTLEDFKGWAVVQQIDSALNKARAALQTQAGGE